MDHPHASLLLGRQREVAHIEELLTHAQDGTSAALLLHGEPGIGQSSLLKTAWERAQELGFTVLPTWGFEPESDMPFAGPRRCFTASRCRPGS